MKIFIFTHRRPNKQITYENFSTSMRKETTIICDEIDKKKIERRHPEANFLIYPEELFGKFHEKIAWLIRLNSKLDDSRIIFLDDDIKFFNKVEVEEQGKTKIRLLKNDVISDTEPMFEMLWDKLNEFVHVGVIPRNLVTRQPFELDWLENSKAIGIHGYRCKEVDENIDLDNLPLIKVDYHTTMELLKGGFPNRILTKYCMDPGYNQPGGFSEFRNKETYDHWFDIYVDNHKDFITVKEKKYKNNSNGMGERREVINYWKKAFSFGLKEFGERRIVDNKIKIIEDK